jgi:hypothetical protein
MKPWIKCMGLVTLAARRQILTNKLFKNIVNDPDDKLHDLLPPVNSHTCEEEECFKFLLLKQIDLRMILLTVIHVNM